MIEKFVEKYAKLLASYPDKIRVEKRLINNEYAEIFIYAMAVDAGKLIGKDGNMINAIKTLISGCKAKNGVSYKVQVNIIE